MNKINAYRHRGVLAIFLKSCEMKSQDSGVNTPFAPILKFDVLGSIQPVIRE